MPIAAVASDATTGGFLLVLAIMLPVAGILLSLVLGGRCIERIALVLLPAGLAIATAVFVAVWRGGHALVYLVGGWEPPLGIALRADGLSAAMMMTTAIVICATGLFAHGEFSQPRGLPEARAPFVFWILLFAIWGALNAVVLGNDLFNLYVALELLTFAAVPLVCLKGHAETIKSALRYMLFALLGSVLYLLGTVMIYGAYGTLDITLLSGRVRPEPVALIAGALMTVGLLAKTALFPLHLWLPPAHAGAPAPGSAVLSALVVKGSYFLIVRLWFDAMPGLLAPAAAQLLATLGAGAILFGSVLALRQQRLKLLIAYSTIAQIGYLFFIFPLAGEYFRKRTLEQRGMDRRMAPTFLSRLRESRHVHGGRVDRRGAWARPNCRARRRRPRASHDDVRFRAGRTVADGCAAERRLRSQVAPPVGNDHGGAMVVGCGDPCRRTACGRLRLHRAWQGNGPRERIVATVRAGVPAS